MKESFKSNIIIFLLVLTIILLAGNIYMNRLLLKDYVSYQKEENSMEDNIENKEKEVSEVSTVNSINKSNDGIKEFDLKIKYKEEEIEYEYDIKSNDIIKSKYKNELTGEVIKGDEANSIFDKYLKDIDFTAPQSQVVDLIINNLDLDTDFTDFDLEVEYNDGTEVDIEISNQ